MPTIQSFCRGGRLVGSQVPPSPKLSGEWKAELLSSPTQDLLVTSFPNKSSRTGRIFGRKEDQAAKLPSHHLEF